MLDATNRTRAAAEEPARKPATEVPMEAMASKQLAYMEEVARAKRNVQLANLRNTESEILLEMAKLNAQLEKVRIELFRTELEEKATAKEQLPGKSKEWRELSAAEARAARALGFNEDSWQDGGSPEPCQKPWNKLAPSLASAATLLGYNEHGDSPPACMKRWSGLSGSERQAAEVLGYSQLAWERELEVELS